MEKLYLESIGFTKPTIVRKDNIKIETVGLCVDDLVETWRKCFDISFGTIYLVCKECDMIAISKRTMTSVKSVKELFSEKGVKCVVEEIQNGTKSSLYVRMLRGEMSYEEYIAKKEKNERRNEKRRKYKVGKQITSVEELLSQKIVMFHVKPIPVSWVRNWQLSFIVGQLHHGQIKYAIKNNK